jgi:selenocysteine lyase/cysteine desulfurase
MMDIAAVRKEFPALGECVYFNTASEGALSRRGTLAALDCLERKANPARFALRDYFDIPRRARRAAARLIGAEEGTISLVPSTSCAENTVANGLPLEMGDEVLLLRGQFPSGVHPWLNLRRRGVSIKFLECPMDEIRAETFLPHLGPRTRVAAFDWVQFSTGARADLAGIVPALRARGIVTVVDATQGLGALELRSHHPDVVIASGHKWLLSPVGTGFMCVSPRVRSMLHPPFLGWISHLKAENFADLVDYDGCPTAADGRAFETGSPALDHLLALAVNLEWLAELGPSEIEAYLHEMERPLLDWLRRRGFETAGAREESRRSAIVSFRAQGMDMESLHRGLLKEKVICSLREGFVRLSPHFYNTAEEVAACLRVLEKLC